MIILAVDTSAATACAALTQDSTPIAEISVEGAKTHSETLLPMIERLLEFAHVSLDQVDLFACCTGPGSFTGIRIGVSVIKGLAFGRNKPCVSLSSTEILAYMGNGLSEITVCPVSDARRDQYYTALFENGVRLTEDRLLTQNELIAELVSRNRPVCFVGDGAKKAEQALREINPALAFSVSPLMYQPNGYAAAACALRHYRDGEICTDAALIPVYLRATQAERELQEKEQKIRSADFDKQSVEH